MYTHFVTCVISASGGVLQEINDQLAREKTEHDANFRITLIESKNIYLRHVDKGIHIRSWFSIYFNNPLKSIKTISVHGTPMTPPGNFNSALHTHPTHTKNIISCLLWMRRTTILKQTHLYLAT